MGIRWTSITPGIVLVRPKEINTLWIPKTTAIPGTIVGAKINNSTYSLPLNLYIPNALPAGTPIKMDKSVATEEMNIVSNRLSSTPAVSDNA